MGYSKNVMYFKIIESEANQDVSSLGIEEKKNKDFCLQVVKACTRFEELAKLTRAQMTMELKKRNLPQQWMNWTSYGQCMRLIEKDFGNSVYQVLNRMYMMK